MMPLQRFAIWIYGTGAASKNKMLILLVFGPLHCEVRCEHVKIVETVIDWLKNPPIRLTELLHVLHENELPDDDKKTIQKMNAVTEIVGVNMDNEKMLLYDGSGIIIIVDRCGC